MFQTKRTGGVFAAMFRFCPDEAKQKRAGTCESPGLWSFGCKCDAYFLK